MAFLSVLALWATSAMGMYLAFRSDDADVRERAIDQALAIFWPFIILGFVAFTPVVLYVAFAECAAKKRRDEEDEEVR